MNILKEKSSKYSIKKNLIFGFCLYCTFYIAYFLGGLSYLAPYIDDEITPFFIMCFICYYVVCFLYGIIATDSARKSFNFLHLTLLGGVMLFFLYLIPFKERFTNEFADMAYHGILKDMGMSSDKTETLHTNKDIDEVYEAYKNRDISKLKYFDSKINDVLKIKDETFAQLIVNVRVLNKKVITDFYNKILEDKRISVNEYNEMIKLIVSEEVK
jgi:hypothetical protein